MSYFAASVAPASHAYVAFYGSWGKGIAAASAINELYKAL